MNTQMAISEIKSVLFETGKYAVIGETEMSNTEARTFLFNQDNQQELMNVIDNGTHLLIW